MEELPLLSREAPIRKELWGTLDPQATFRCSKEFMHEGLREHSLVLLFEATGDQEEQIACILAPVQKEEQYVEFGDPKLELITLENSPNLSPRVFTHACLTLSWKGENLKATFFGDKQSTLHLKPAMAARSSTTGKVCVVFEKQMASGYKRCILGPVPNSALP